MTSYYTFESPSGFELTYHKSEPGMWYEAECLFCESSDKVLLSVDGNCRSEIVTVCMDCIVNGYQNACGMQQETLESLYGRLQKLEQEVVELKMSSMAL